MSPFACSKHADGAEGKRCGAMHAAKSLVSGVARAVGTAFWIRSMMAGDGMIVGEKQQPPQGDNRIIDPAYGCNKLIYCQRSQNTASPLGTRTGYHTPVSRDQGFSPTTGQDGGFDTPIDSLPDSTGLSSLQRSYTSDANGPESQQLSPNEMIAPASAVHSMSVNLLDTNDVSHSHTIYTGDVNLTGQDLHGKFSQG